MHDCQRFREDWIGGAFGEEPGCEPCRLFCKEARVIFAALDASPNSVPEASEQYWVWFENRLKARLVEERAAADLRVSRYRWIAACATAASVAVALTWGSLFLPGPAMDQAGTAPVRIEFDKNHILDLDPGVVDFLGQSELFVRDFTKIEPSYKEDIEDARFRASRSLTELARQKQAARNFDPVWITLDEYESVLREIKNLDSPEDITDIQMRIRRNGLIANLKAYQPRAVLVSQR